MRDELGTCSQPSARPSELQAASRNTQDGSGGEEGSEGGGFSGGRREDERWAEGLSFHPSVSVARPFSARYRAHLRVKAGRGVGGAGLQGRPRICLFATPPGDVGGGGEGEGHHSSTGLVGSCSSANISVIERR